MQQRPSLSEPSVLTCVAFFNPGRPLTELECVCLQRAIVFRVLQQDLGFGPDRCPQGEKACDLKKKSSRMLRTCLHLPTLRYQEPNSPTESSIDPQAVCFSE